VNLDYPEIFRHRGDQYHDAMTRCPRARDREFETLFAAAPVEAGQRVLDIPAGGAYLARFLPATAELLSMELTPGFGTDVTVHDPAQSWEWGDFDHVVCLAALHHIEQQPDFIRGLVSRLRRGGTLHVADVCRGSGLSRFLDEFVDRYGTTGHEGNYLSEDAAFFSGLGRVSRIGQFECPWIFKDDAEMLGFCSRLFGLADCPPEHLMLALQEHVGVARCADGIRLNWRLLYVDLQPYD
jgi:hypothetical protein